MVKKTAKKKVVKKKSVKAKVPKPANPKKVRKKVVIYSTHTCPWCKKTKEFFRVNKVKFMNKFVDNNKKNAQEMIKKSGQQGVPVVLVGDKVIVGYNESKLKNALGL